MDRDGRIGDDSNNTLRIIKEEVQNVEYPDGSNNDLTAQNVEGDTNKSMNSNMRAVKVKEEINATDESYDMPSDEWLVESVDDSGQEDGRMSDDDEDATEIDELVDLSKSIASDETNNFWYLLRACALGEQRIGRFIINGIDYVVMGEVAFECDAKTNLVDYLAKRKLKRTLLHTVEEIFLCYLYYTRGKFQAYSRRLGKLHKRKLGAASAVRLDEYLYVRNARLPEFISGMFPPPTAIKLSEILCGEKLPDSGWNPITFHQKFHRIQETCLTSDDSPRNDISSGIYTDGDQSMKASIIEHAEMNGTEAVSDSANIEIKRSNFSTSEVHKLEHKRTGGRTMLLEGTFYNHSCFMQFLSNWLCHMKRTSHVVHSTIPLSIEQRSALGLSKNQATVAHSYMVVDGLPPSEFYGGGFGVTAKLANWAASREMVTRLYHGGLVTPSLYNEIEDGRTMIEDDRSVSARACKQLRRRKREQFLISKAALETLDQYLAIEEVPKQFLENTASDSVVNASVIEKTKRAVQRAHNAIKSVETMENALARGKRKAVDIAEQEVIAAKRNRMITVLPEEVAKKADTASSAVATECIEKKSAENSISLEKEVFDFVKLFEEDLPAENALISPISGDISTQNKSVLSQESVDMASSKNNSMENIIEFVKLFDDDETLEENSGVLPNKRVLYTPNDDCECIFVAEVRKKGKEIPVVTIDDDNDRREFVKGSTSTSKPEREYGPDRVDTQTPSTSYLPPMRNGGQSVSNNNDGHKAGEIDMEIEEDREEITVLSDDVGQQRSTSTLRPYNGPPSMIALQKLNEMDLRMRLGVTIVASALDVYDTIKARRKRYQQGFDAFDAHIWRHYRLNGQDDRTFSWKMEVRERLLSLVKTVYEDANIVAVGSTVNGCGAYNSDMDLCLCLPDAVYGYDTDRDYGVRVLKKVFRVLAYQSNGLVRKCHCIPAKVPILKLEMGNEYSELEIDINCNNVAGIYNSHLLHYYARIDDRFPALCLLVKHWAINAGINDAMSGTFNSYSLILLVLHFLQCATMPPVLPNLQVLHPDIFNGHCGLDNLELFRNVPPLPSRELNRNTVGELLIAFFDYYAKFDFINKAISIHRGCVFDRSDLATSTRRFKVFIEEPFDHENTARCVTRVDSAKHIKQVFIAARNAFLGANAGIPLLKLIDVH